MDPLHETIADIAYAAGLAHYYTGDSRRDVATIIGWAREFEEKYRHVAWGITPDLDYIVQVEEFVEEKLKNKTQ